MSTRVMVPPDPLVSPADVPGGHGPDDAAVAAMIVAAQRLIDGPSGWLGICLGPQTLETVVRCWSDVETALFGPVIDIESILYIDASGDEHQVPDDDWLLDGGRLYLASSWVRPALASRRFPIKITYDAGYNESDPYSGGTGDIPENAKAAIIDAVQQLILARSDTLGLRSVETVDVETITYLDADKVSAIMRNASSDLLSGLWVPRI
ncbi:hypothetical protein [Mesorhizobium sp. B2-3-4]|uniref:hypothetical protein n=1 Tax=Mesorhizobium sp. B2-3-4 TaxID=2589959 RepID=UPI00112EBBD3|nr:hypothetical protein [Mesorhizobium sp. B2-3-4]TPM41547.1 hypothetical protein FJ967_01020 [Mesorhizobium sp. B2-3-4]